MNPRDDLFGELLPAAYYTDDQARAIDFGFFAAGCATRHGLRSGLGLSCPPARCASARGRVMRAATCLATTEAAPGKGVCDGHHSRTAHT